MKRIWSSAVKPFEFTNQDGKPFGLLDLKGKWWVSDFVFTKCTFVCLPMTSNMALLQKKAKEANLDVQFVSFSVDPQRDAPKELKHYAKQYGADTANWNFLTGYDFMTMKEISIKTFQSMMAMPEKDKDGDYQVTHSTRFYLVNPEAK